MVTQVILPKLAANVEEATIGQWFLQEGDAVARGDLLFEAITDKAAVELKAEGGGVLRRILAAPNSVVPVGQVIALIAEADEELPEVAAPTAPAQEAQTAAPARVKASFGARRLAKQLGVHITAIVPSRDDGRITEDDVRRTADRGVPPATTQAGPAAREVIPLSPLKRALAAHLERTARGVVPAVVSRAVDFCAVQAFLPTFNEMHGAAARPRDVVVHAAARALREYPLLNACFAPQGITVYAPAHIGLAFDIERDDAVLVPVLRDADTKDLATIAREAADLEQRLQAHELGPDDFADATFTLADQSHLDIDSFVPILPERQSAVLAVSSIRRTPTCQGDGSLTTPYTAALAVAFDHRVLNGTTAARFLHTVREAIESFAPDR